MKKLKNELKKIGYELIEIQKLNGMNRTGITPIQKKEVNPIVYIDDIIQKYTNDEVSLSAAMKEISNIYNSSTENQPRIDISQLNKEFILKNINPCLVNYGKNKGLLKGVVHRKVLDLALTYRVCLESETETENGVVPTAKISKELAEKYNLSEEELFFSSLKVIEKEKTIDSMMKYVSKVFGFEADEDKADEDEIMYILSNKKKLFGAAQIINESALKDFHKKYGDYYVLPSSIHEVILLPKKFAPTDDVGYLVEMVKEVNETRVQEDEVLSESVYEFTEKGLKIAS